MSKKRKVIRILEQNVPADVKAMREEILRLKTARELEGLKKISETPKAPASLEERYKREIKELEEKRANIPKGFKGLVAKANINYHINQRKAYLNDKLKTERLKDQLNLTMIKSNLESEREKLIASKKKNMITFDDLFGNSGGVKF